MFIINPNMAKEDAHAFPHAKQQAQKPKSTAFSIPSFISYLIHILTNLIGAFSSLPQEDILSRFRSATTLSNTNITRQSDLLLPRKKKTLVLDLDETLIHSTLRNTTGGDYQVEICINGDSFVFNVFKRPHVDYFLKTVSEWYDIIIFTASLRQYADPVIDRLDPNRYAKKRLFRESCRLMNGSFVKDFNHAGFDLPTTIIVDNSPVSYVVNQDNAIPIDHFYANEASHYMSVPGSHSIFSNQSGSMSGQSQKSIGPNDWKKDRALLDLLPILNGLRYTHDVRSVLGLSIQ
eukprot:TRINITY_DN2717_c0_g1_i1.p1 TRINITY_DN2717_c0_g1~~TRINITY_DN2717_c0_g1_i1.p1  ORF type:complete len:291 (+),score=61.01 TRINITY_DN2717_c0_g1_i1:97-969(+)